MSENINDRVALFEICKSTEGAPRINLSNETEPLAILFRPLINKNN